MPDTHPNLPLEHDWDAGENVKSGMDANLRLLGAVVHLAVESRTSDEPNEPEDGERYIHNGGTWSIGSAGDVIARIADEWYAYTPADGWLAKCRDESRWIEYETAAGDWVAFDSVLHNDSATADPTATDDSDAGYSAGSRWYNTNNGELFRCVDATVGAAVWVKTTLTLDELGNAAVADFATESEHEAGSSTSKVANPAGVHAALGKYGVGALSPQIPNDDLTQDIETGIYWLTPDSTKGAPKDSGWRHTVIVVKRSLTASGYILYPSHADNNPEVYFGQRNSSTGSIDWQRSIMSDDLAANGGTVPQDNVAETISAKWNFEADAQIDGSDIGPIESGTFTPVLEGGDAAGNHTYLAQDGIYLRRGNILHIEIRMDLDTFDTNASGNFEISGLPFSAANPYNAAELSSFTQFDSLPSGIIDMQTRINNDRIEFRYLNDGGGSTALDVSRANAGTRVRLSATYEI